MAKLGTVHQIDFGLAFRPVSLELMRIFTLHQRVATEL